MPPNRCRTCDARIFWAINDRTGKRSPIDDVPDPDGPIVIVSGPPPVYHVLTKAEREAGTFDGAITYSNHWQTCRDRDDWKRRMKERP